MCIKQLWKTSLILVLNLFSRLESIFVILHLAALGWKRCAHNRIAYLVCLIWYTLDLHLHIYVYTCVVHISHYISAYMSYNIYFKLAKIATLISFHLHIIFSSFYEHWTCCKISSRRDTLVPNHFVFRLGICSGFHLPAQAWTVICVWFLSL